MKSLSRLALAAASAALLLGLASPARADDRPAAMPSDEPSASGLRLGLRSGVALPFGSAFTGSGALSDTITGYVPVRIDIGYRIANHLYIGVDAQRAMVVPRQCNVGFTCSGTDTRIGVMAAWHFLPKRSFDPYVGIGTGYEILDTSRSIGSASVDISARGLEMLDMEAGGDVRLGRSLRIGPVLSGSMGRFTTVAVNGTPSSDYDTALHAWAMLGFRGAFDL